MSRNERSSLETFLSQQPNVGSDDYWDRLDELTSLSEKWNFKLTQKAKKNLTAIFKSARRPSTLVSFLQRIVNESQFLQSFTDRDCEFFRELSRFTKKMIEKQAFPIQEVERFLNILSELCRQEFSRDFGKYIVLPLIDAATTLEYPSNLSRQCISILFILIDSSCQESCREIIASRAQQLLEAARVAKNPRIQLQFTELLWRQKVHLNELNFSEADTQSFLDQSHLTLIAKNNQTLDRIFNLQIQRVAIDDSDLIGENGWLDIGFDELLIIFGTTIIPISFKSINGLDFEDGIINITLADDIEAVGSDSQVFRASSGQVIHIAFIDIPAQPVIESIFERIKSVNDTVPQQENFDQNFKDDNQNFNDDNQNFNGNNQNFNDDLTIPKRVKSSIAMFCPSMSQRSQNSQVDAALFNEAKPQEISKDHQMSKKDRLNLPLSETDTDFPEIAFQTAPSSPQLPYQVDDQNNIDENDENISNNRSNTKTTMKNKKVRGKKRNQKIEEIPNNNMNNENYGNNDYDNDNEKKEDPESTLLKMFQTKCTNLGSVFSRGLESLKKQQASKPEGATIKFEGHCDSFQADVRKVMNERQNGSVKQIFTMRNQFQTNVTHFKRKEEVIQGRLTEIDGTMRELNTKVIQIQKRLRQELQKQRIDLEKELARLRSETREIDNDLEEISLYTD